LQLARDCVQGVHRRIAADQHRIGRGRCNRRERDLGLRAGIDHEIVVALRQRADGGPQHLRLEQACGVAANLARGDQMRPRTAVAGDDVAERSLPTDEFGDAGCCRIVRDDVDVRRAERQIDQHYARGAGQGARQRDRGERRADVSCAADHGNAAATLARLMKGRDNIVDSRTRGCRRGRSRHGN
jgi:hypothetical protein